MFRLETSIVIFATIAVAFVPLALFVVVPLAPVLVRIPRERKDLPRHLVAGVLVALAVVCGYFVARVTNIIGGICATAFLGIPIFGMWESMKERGAVAWWRRVDDRVVRAEIFDLGPELGRACDEARRRKLQFSKPDLEALIDRKHLARLKSGSSGFDSEFYSLLSLGCSRVPTRACHYI